MTVTIAQPPSVETVASRSRFTNVAGVWVCEMDNPEGVVVVRDEDSAGRISVTLYRSIFRADKRGSVVDFTPGEIAALRETFRAEITAEVLASIDDAPSPTKGSFQEATQ